MTQKPKVVVGTLTWNQKERTVRWFESISKLDYPNFTVVVVDNHSTDGTAEAIRQKFPQIHVIRHRENLGFGEGINSQFRFAFEAGADYLFIVENDGEVDPGTLSVLAGACGKDLQIGAAFPKVCHREKRNQVWPARGTGLEEINLEINRSPIGICLIRMEAVKKAGYLDPGYFVFFDDADWLMRLRQAGYREQNVLEALAWHGPPNERSVDSASRTYYQVRNRLYFVQKYAQPERFLGFFFFSFFKVCFWDLPALILNGKREALRGIGWAWIDFFKGKRGRREFSTMKKNVFFRGGRKILDGFSAIGREMRFWLKRRAGKPLKIRVRVDWNIGDEVIATPVYEGLKRKYPNSVIDTEVRFPAVVQENPFVDSINRGTGFNPDRVVNLHREVRNRPRRDYLSEFAGLREWSAPKVYLTWEEMEAVRVKWGLAEGTRRVAICPEVGWFTKRWPREKWIKLAERLVQTEGVEVWVLGKEGALLPIGRNLIGETSLREAAAFLSQCHLFVGHDSGPLYLSLAVGTPSLGLYGALNPHFLYPSVPHFVPLWSPVECRGCWPNERMKYPDHCPKIVPDCMTSIAVEQVVEAAELLLSKMNFDTLAKQTP